MRGESEVGDEELSSIIHLNPRDPVHRKLIADRILVYRNAKGLRNAEFVRELEAFVAREYQKPDYRFSLKDEAFRQFLSKHTKGPSADEMNYVRAFLQRCGYWDHDDAKLRAVRAVDGHLFYSLTEYLEIPSLTARNLRVRAPGVYRVYRPIITHEKEFVIGLAVIANEVKSGAVTYKEFNRIQPKAGRQGKAVTFEGYVIRKTNFIYLIGRDTSKSASHFTIISHCEGENGKITVMFGGFLDTLGAQLYTGKVFFERVADSMPNSQVEAEALALDSFPASKLPPSIQAYFSRHEDYGNVRVY